MKLTNVGPVETFLPSGSPDIWSYEVDLRDARGTPVPRTSEWMRAISERPTNVTLNVSLPLAAGASLTKTVILDKLFDLRRPGHYTVRLSFDSFACGHSGTRVTSNLTNFTVGAPLNQPSGSKSGISVTASASRTQLPIGWAVPLDIVVQNKSTRPLRWAVDDPPNTAPDEFLTGAEVFGPAGEMRQAPREPDPNWSFSRFRDTASTLEIPLGKSAEQTVLLGDVFDVSKPGNYRAKVSLVDPLSNRLIDSNTVAFEIEDQASSSSLPKQPPFIVTLRSAYFLPPDPGNVLICMSNISDHDIPLDNSALKDFTSVEAPDGTAAAMNETALKDWKPENLKRAPAASVQSNTWDFAVKPRKALCGGLKVGVIYDLSRPGAYRVRIDRYDEPDAMMGQKLGELPLVHSNWLTIFEPYPASSGNK
ncbi:hypothetical protein [Edaphobacter aggregans]|uniref:hypothetical protein n=1 Tax=Edaphobacter aggregans TaxID=570835 RepID=UPI000554698B|nr:hypothetical protein [Edaphobacter aggregans]